ncbi:cadherin-like domain-containing protein [Indioceanicola profundi]|uniref:cadherin-like domain-containing protein n=1 Tax=Indioceanicola profundi TaxID=2220096 RepID=UPI0013C47701|nr:cadherin-like domain-containing protein [Indioceanicola profundi]
MIPLEPRVMFDAAAVASVVGLVDQAASAQAAPPEVESAAPQPDPTPTYDNAPTIGQSAGPVLVFASANDVGRLDMLAGMPAGATVIGLEPGRDPLARITEVLAGAQGVEQVHLILNGEDEGPELAGSLIGPAQITASAQQVAGWSDAFAATPAIIVHGADGAASQYMADELRNLTGARIVLQPPAAQSDAVAGGAPSSILERAATDFVPLAASAEPVRRPAVASVELLASGPGEDVLSSVSDKAVQGVPVADAAALILDRTEGAQSGRTEVVFVSTGIAGWEQLVAGLGDGVEVVLLAPEQDGIAQIAETLSGRTGIDALHILSHGADGRLLLGGEATDLAGLEARSDLLAAIGSSLGADADILLYGCDVAAGPDGQSFIARLAALTGADLAASSNSTGAAALGGDWTLEHTIGAVEAAAVLTDRTAAGFQDLLAPVTLATAGTPLSFTEGQEAIAIDPALTFSGADSDDRPTSAVVEITAGTVASDRLTAPGGLPAGITVTQDSATRLRFTIGSDVTFDQLRDVLRGVTFQNTGNAPGDSRTVTFTVSYSDNGAQQPDVSAARTIAVTPVNDAPVSTGNAALAGINEGVLNSTGTLVSNLLAGAGISDPDGTPAGSLGIIITGTDGSQGTWEYSLDGGATWSNIGPRTAATALALLGDSDNRIRFVPADPDFSGDATFSFRAWDGPQTGQADGDTLDASATGGSTAFGTDERTASIAVANTNDSPELLTPGYTKQLGAITEDPEDSANTGFTAGSLLGIDLTNDQVRDIDAGDMLGVAISGTGGMAGAWQYQAAGSTTWTDLPAIVGDQVFLLAANDKLRFVPAANQAGEAILTFRAWDGSAGTSGAVSGTAVAASALIPSGGETALSADSGNAVLSITALNDAPTLTASTVTAPETAAAGGITLTAGHLSAVDVDNPAGALVYTLTSIPAGMQVLSKISGVTVTLSVGQSFTQADVQAGRVSVQYTGADLTADSSFAIGLSVRDGAGGETAGTLAVNLTEVNAPISLTTTGVSVTEYVPGVTNSAQFTPIALGISDADAAAGIRTVTIDVLTDESYGWLEYSLDGNTWTKLADATAFSGAEATALQLRFVQFSTADEPPAGTATSFNVTVDDGRGSTDTRTVAISIAQVNDLPLQPGTAAGFIVDQGGQRTFNDAANVHLGIADPDSQPTKAVYTLRSLPQHGGLFLNGVQIGIGATFSQADIDIGLLQYRHEGDDGTDDSFDYTLRDGDGGASTGTFNITVEPNGEPVTTGVGRLIMPVNSTYFLTNALLNYSDPDTPAGNVVFTLTEPVPNAELQVWNGSAWVAQASFTLAQLTADGPSGAASQVQFVHTGGNDDAGTYGGSFTVTDGTSTSLPQQLPITLVSSEQTGGDGGVSHGSAQPVVNTNRQLIIAEGSLRTDAANTISSTYLRASDVGTAASDVTYTLVSTPTNGAVLYRDGVALGANATFTQAEIDANRLTVGHDGSEVTSASFVFRVADGSGNVTKDQTFSIVVTPVNDVPVLTTTIGTIHVLEQDSTTDSSTPPGSLQAPNVTTPTASAVLLTIDVLGAGGAVGATDVDAGTTFDQLIYILTDAPNGGEIRVWDGANWTGVAEGGRFSANDVRANRVAYFHAAGSEPSAPTDKFTVVLADGATFTSGENAGKEMHSAPLTVSIDVTNVNDAPNANGATVSLNEGGTIILTGISASDSDTPVENLVYEIRTLPAADAGTLWLDENGNNQQDSGEELTVGDTFTDAQREAGLVRFTHSGKEVFAASFTFKVKETGATTLESSDATVNLRITPANEAPDISTGEAVVYEGQQVILTQEHLLGTDPETYNPDDTSLTGDAELIQFRITGAVSNGRLLLVDGTSRIPLGTGSVFSMADVLAGRIVYIHSGSETTTDGFSVSLSDGTSNAPAAGTVAIDVKPVNDSPVLTRPKSYVVDEDATLVLTGLKVSDIDAGDDQIEVRLQVPSGILTVNAGVPGGVTAVAGNNTGTVILTGTVAQINATLAHASGVTFFAGNNVSGTVNLTVTVNDLGRNGTDPSAVLLDEVQNETLNTPNTGGTGDQTATDTLVITVRPLNDAPVITNADQADTNPTFQESSGTPVALVDIANDADISDVDVTDFNGFRITVTLDQYRPGDLLMIDGSVTGGFSGFTSSGGNGVALVIDFTGATTAAQVRAVLNAIRFDNTGDDPTVKGTDAERTYTVTLNDRGNVGAGGARSATPITGVITLEGENDAPTLGNQTRILPSIAEDIASGPNTGRTVTEILGYSSGTASDPDNTNIGILVTSVTDTNGKWQYWDGSAWADLSGKVNGTDGLLLAHDDRVRFMPAEDYHGSTTGGFQFRAWDQSNIADSDARTTVPLSGLATGGTSPYSSVEAQATITVSPVNDAPVISVPDTVTGVTEGIGNDAISDWVQLSNTAVLTAERELLTENLGFDKTTLTVARRDGVVTTDRFDLGGNPAVSMDGSNVVVSSVTVGTVTISNGQLVVTFNNAATQASIAEVMRAVRFATVMDALGAGATVDATIRFTFSDQNGNGAADQGSGGAKAASADVVVTITGTNDTPTSSNFTKTVNEDTVLSLTAGDFPFSDEDAGDARSAIRFDTVPTKGRLWIENDGIEGFGGTDVSVNANDVILQADLGKLRYQAALNESGTGYASLTFSVRDGQNAFSAAPSTMTINVTALNDVPALDGTAFNGSLNESSVVGVGTAPQRLLSNVTVADIDLSTTPALSADPNRFGGGRIIITLTGGVAGDMLTVAGGTLAGMSGAATGGTNGAALTINLANTATLDQVKAILESIQFQHTTDNPPAGARAYSVVLQDGSNTRGDSTNAGTGGSLSSTALTGSISIVQSNDPPSGADATRTIDEDTAYSFVEADFGFTDPDVADTLGGVQIDTLPVGGTLWLEGGGASDTYDSGTDTLVTAGQTLTKAQIASLRFRPAQDANGTGYTSLTFSVQDNGGAYDTAPNTLTFNVTPRNDAPVLGGTVYTGTLTESGTTGEGTPTAHQLLSDVSVTDIDLGTTGGLSGDSTQFGGGSITVTLTGGSTGDMLTVAGGMLAGMAGVASGGTNGTTLTITLANTVTLDQVKAILEAIRYQHTTDTPPSGTRAYTVTLSDGNNTRGGGVNAGGPGALTAQLAGSITIEPTNDRPETDLNGSGGGTGHSFTWNEPVNATHTAVNITTNTATITDADNSNLVGMTLTVAGAVNEGAEFLLIGGIRFALNEARSNVDIGSFLVSYDPGTGIFTITPDNEATRTKTDFQTLLQGIQYLHESDNPTAGDRTIKVEVTDAGSNDAGGAGQLTSIVTTSTITVAPANDQPTISDLAGSVQFYENDLNAGPVLLDSNIKLTDIDSGSYDGTVLRVTGIAAQDNISVLLPAAVTAGSGAVQRDGNNIQYHNGTGWLTIGTAAGGTAGADFTVTFNGTASLAMIERVVESLTIQTDSQHPDATRTLTLSVKEPGGTAVTGAMTVDVVRENDAPTANTAIPGLTVPEAGGTVTLDTSNWNIVIGDVDALTGLLSVTVTLSHGTITAVGGAGGTLGELNGSSLTITGATAAELTSRLNALTIRLPDPDGAGPATAADWNGTLTVTLVVNDGGNSGERPRSLIGDTNDAAENPGDIDYAGPTLADLQVTRTFQVTVSPTEDAPVANPNTGSVTEDGTTTSTGNLITDATADHDVDSAGGSGPGHTLSIIGIRTGTGSSGFTVVPGGGYSIDGNYGTLHVANDGTYTYTLNNSLPAVQGLRAGQSLADVFTYQLSDGTAGDEAAATLTITINGADDAPAVDLNGSGTSGIDRTVTFSEQQGADTGATAVQPFGPGTLTDADSAKLSRLTITAANIADGNAEILTIGGTDFALGSSKSATITVGGATFTIALTNPGTAPTIIVTVQGGGTATKAQFEALLQGIAYRNASDTPSTAADRTFSVAVRDAGSNDATGNGGNNSLTSSPVAVATVIVAAVNDAPVVDLDNTDANPAVNEAVTFTEGANTAGIPVAIAANAVISDRDNTNLTQLVLTIDGLADEGDEVLTIGGTRVTLAPGTSTLTVGSFTVDVNTTATSSTITITPLTGAVYALTDVQALLRGITYANESDSPTVQPRTVQVQVTDAGTSNTDTTGAADSNRPQSTITLVAVNDKPRLSAEADVTFEENTVNTEAQPLISDGSMVITDKDTSILSGATLTVSGLIAGQDVVSLPSGAELPGTGSLGQVFLRNGDGSVHVHDGSAWVQVGAATGGNGTDFVVTFNASATQDRVADVMEALTYANSSDRPTATRTLSLTLDDNIAGGSTQAETIQVTVNANNDTPVIQDFGPTAPAYTEDGPAIVLDANVQIGDPDLGTASGGPNDYRGVRLTFERSSGANGEDVFGFSGSATEPGTIYADGSILRLSNGTASSADDPQIGTIDTGTAGRLQITFAGTAAVTQATASLVAQSVTYRNTNENVNGVSVGPVSIRLTVNDAAGSTSAAQGSGAARSMAAQTSVAIIPVNEPIRTGAPPTLSRADYFEKRLIPFRPVNPTHRIA